jgi:hypothetical protein
MSSAASRTQRQPERSAAVTASTGTTAATSSAASNIAPSSTTRRTVTTPPTRSQRERSSATSTSTQAVVPNRQQPTDGATTSTSAMSSANTRPKNPITPASQNMAIDPNPVPLIDDPDPYDEDPNIQPVRKRHKLMTQTASAIVTVDKVPIEFPASNKTLQRINERTTPDWLLTDRGVDPWETERTDIYLPEGLRFKRVDMTQFIPFVHRNLVFSYSIISKLNKISECYIRLSRQNDGHVFTVNVCLCTDPPDSEDIEIRTFKMNTVQYSGLLLDAIAYFCSLPTTRYVLGRDVKRLIYNFYPEEFLSTAYFDYLVKKGIWKYQVPKRGEDGYHYFKI